MSGGIHIRPAKAKDAALIGHVFHQAWRETYRGLLPDDIVDGLQADTVAEEWAAKLAPDGGSFCLLAETGAGAPIGFGGGAILPAPEDGCDGLLDSLYFLKGHHGGGLGRELVRRIAANLSAAGATRMKVVVLASNPALEFYKRLGAEVILERERLHRGHLCPEVVLAWSLPLSSAP